MAAAVIALATGLIGVVVGALLDRRFRDIDATKSEARKVTLIARERLVAAMGDVRVGNDDAQLSNDSSTMLRHITVTATNNLGESETRSFDPIEPGEWKNVPMSSQGQGVTAIATFTINEVRWRFTSEGKLKRVR